jgi:acetoin:2,6-dichlorophenolindophenol oxidoreductase subunit alpha
VSGEGGTGAMLELYERMCLVRAFDARLAELYTKGLVRGSTHAALGQEASAVGACAALAPGDLITSTHRGHGHAIAKGADVRRMMAELLGRASGYCRGKGGSMHIADFGIGMLGANGIVGGGLGIAGGAALTSSLKRDGRVTLCFFGEGAANQGAFHEVANLAGIWRLPLVLFCENNRYAMSADVGSMLAGGDIAARAAGYGFPGVTVDGMDVLAVRDAVARAARRARSGEGPSLVVADCFRYAGHFSGDLMRYIPDDEMEQWQGRDPVEGFAARLLAEGATDAELAAAREAASAAVQDALDWALAQPLPAPEEAEEDLFA